MDKTQKIEIAKDLHHKYNASNKQIKRVLRLDETIIEELFPKNGEGGGVTGTKKGAFEAPFMLRYKDSNLDRQNQNL